MQSKIIKITLLVLALSLLCCGCANEALSPSAESIVLSELRSSYRSASLIATAACTEALPDTLGTRCVKLRLSEILAGRASAGEELICANNNMQAGNDYLVYLRYNDELGAYEPVTSGLWNPAIDSASFNDDTLALSELRNDIAQLQSVISAPSETLYYNELSILVDASDAVCIGRVLTAPALVETSFREDSNTATIEHSRPAAIVPVQVYGSIKGDLEYGETISFIYSPAYASDLVDATTLKAFSCSEADVPALSEGYFLFFLRQGPDAKQNYYFGINPLQSHVSLEQDMLLAAESNEALKPYSTLPDMLDALDNKKS